MKNIMFFIISTFLLFLALSQASIASATPSADCESAGTGGIPPLTSVVISFNCSAPAAVYVGVCDNGGVPNDDLFSIEYAGNVVSFNQYVNDVELATVGMVSVSSGTHSAILRSLNVGVGPATYSYATSSSQLAVLTALSNACGSDFGGQSSPGACDRLVPVFTMDTAPSNGTLVFNVQFGELNRQEGITVRRWDVTVGQRINNDQTVFPTPNWGRLWWQPDGDSTWYLLPSQYWQGDGTPASEYGLDCESSAVPSYHTSFGRAIPESEIPPFNPDG